MDKKTTVIKKIKTADLFASLKNGLSSFMSNYITFTEEKSDTKHRMNFTIKGIGFSFLAYFFGSCATVMSVYPLGVALLSSVSSYTPFIYIGLIISSLLSSGEAIAMFLMYTMGILLRFILSCSMAEKRKTPLFSEGIAFRILISGAMMSMIGIYRCVSGGFLWYDFFGLLFGILIAPLLTLVYCGAFMKNHRFTSYHDLGLAVLMASCIYALKGFSVWGFSLAAIAAFTVALYISKECGMLRGGVAGLIAGLAYSPIYSPLFAIAGLISGLFWRVGSAAATIIALICGIVYGIYADGFSTLSTLAPDLLAGSVIFIPLTKYGILPRPTLYFGGGTISDNYVDRIAVADKKEESGRMKFKAISEALTSLSKTFYSLSGAQMKPELSHVKSRVKLCFDSVCTSCPRRVICWDENSDDTSDAVRNIAHFVYNGNMLTRSDIPAFLIKRCNRIEDIVNRVNKGYSMQLSDAMKSNKAEIFAIDYAAMSALLEDAIIDNAGEYEMDEPLTTKLKSAARYLNLSSSNLAVYGKRRKQIIAGGIDLARVKLGTDELRRSFERICKTPLTSPEFTVEKGHISMMLKSARVIKVQTAHASSKKIPEDINGDTITFFENNEDYFYALLGDGMGSGRDAALTSRLAGVYLDKMLRAGNRKEQALDMLNSFLRQKTFECFTTVDLLEIDLLNSKAAFVKSGATPSYVLRNSSLFKIASISTPIGITKELNAEKVEFDLEPEDIIVMLSDGISESLEDGIWLTDMLVNDWDDSTGIEDMCIRILNEAYERNEGRDDMTVGIVKVIKP